MKTFIMVLVAAATVASAADGVQFTPIDSWEQALKMAKEQNKYLFVDAYTDWCGWCKVMDKKTFTDSGVAALMNAKFVNVKVEMESGYGIDLAIKYRVRSFPQFLVLSPSGQLVYRMGGFAPPADFIPELNNALNPATQEQYPGITAAFPLDSPEFLRKACAKGDVRVMPKAAEVSAWLDAQASVETEVAWSVMSRLALEPKWEQWVIDNQQQLSKKYGSAEVSDRLVSFISSRAEAAVKAQDRAKLEEALASVPESLPYKDRLIAIYRLRFARQAKDWNLVADMLTSDLERGAIDGGVVNEYAWSMYEECSDEQALAKAVTLMQQVAPDAGYAVWDTYAALLFKTKRYDEALTAAQKAIDLGTAEKADVAETESLMKRIREAQ